MAISVPYEDETLRVVTDGHLFIPAWFETPRPEHLRALVRTAEAHARKLGGKKHAVVNMLVGGTPTYSEEMRKLTAEAARRMIPWRQATALVILFGGLRGVVARSISSTVFLLSRSKAPTKVFDSTEAAAPWLLPYLRELEPFEDQRFRDACEAARKIGASASPA